MKVIGRVMEKAVYMCSIFHFFFSPTIQISYNLVNVNYYLRSKDNATSCLR